MKSMRLKQIISLAGLGAAAMLATGCASFRGKQLTQLGPVAKQAAPVIEKGCLELRLTVNGKPPEGGLTKKAIDVHRKIAEEALSECGLVGDLRPASTVTGRVPGEYVLRYDMNNWGSEGAAIASGLICGFSLLAIPGFATDHFTLQAQLIDPEGKTVWAKKYEDKLTTVIWIGFFPCVAAPPLYPGNAAKTVLKNMYRHSLADLAKVNLGRPMVVGKN